jgi:hypothetical protein
VLRSACACLVDSVSFVPDSKYFIAWRPGCGCAFRSLKYFFMCFFGALLTSFCLILRAVVLVFLFFVLVAVLVMACLVFVWMSSSCSFRG